MSLHPDTPADEPLREDIRRWMSAAADGEADALNQACQAWRDDAQARALDEGGKAGSGAVVVDDPDFDGGASDGEGSVGDRVAA